MFQWHPLFAHLLRPVLEGAYDVLTDVPVGDLPRQSDLVIILRKYLEVPIFSGMWRHLSPLNMVEIKGRTESARLRDLPLLAEVGLGIARRWRTEMRKQGQTAIPDNQVSFWYLAPWFGRRFLAGVKELVGDLEEVDAGIFRGRLLAHPLLLVRGRKVTLNRESLPIHLISESDKKSELAVAKVILSEPAWWQEYSLWLKVLYPDVWKEIEAMARRAGVKGLPDFKGVAKMVGVKRFIEEFGPKRLIEELDPKEIVNAIGDKKFRARLTPAQLEKLRRGLS